MPTEKPKKSVFNPKHYDMEVNGQPIEVVDIMEARFQDDLHLAQALKYMMRAGLKDESTYRKDVGKCIWWCCRALWFRGFKKVALPPGIKAE